MRGEIEVLFCISGCDIQEDQIAVKYVKRVSCLINISKPNVADVSFFHRFLDLNSLSTAWTSFLKSLNSARSSFSMLLRSWMP